MHQLGRRQFLIRNSVVGAAAAASISHFPSPVRAAANDRMKVAFIGVGGRGARNLKTIAATGKIDVAAICDIDTRFLDQTGKQFPGAKKFQDFRKLYDAVGKEIDAAVVSTTEHTHAYATMPALQLGKHVYCEKPLAYNIAETRAVTEAAARAADRHANGDPDPCERKLSPSG